MPLIDDCRLMIVELRSSCVASKSQVSRSRNPDVNNQQSSIANPIPLLLTWEPRMGESTRLGRCHGPSSAEFLTIIEYNGGVRTAE